ncbi:hypothetical protein GWK47_003127 [Chionoecetes opilio]|uniref:Uncharacterized protein n=1 Tax=Chionoecetes opilio TaxID=41210 RepID=A0A8J8W9Y3_CHIOP|nr:hypothetical protein GWK47_003127 [Chionoecetes opilio]
MAWRRHRRRPALQFLIEGAHNAHMVLTRVPDSAAKLYGAMYRVAKTDHSSPFNTAGQCSSYHSRNHTGILVTHRIISRRALPSSRAIEHKNPRSLASSVRRSHIVCAVWLTVASLSLSGGAGGPTSHMFSNDREMTLPPNDGHTTPARPARPTKRGVARGRPVGWVVSSGGPVAAGRMKSVGLENSSGAACRPACVVGAFRRGPHLARPDND